MTPIIILTTVGASYDPGELARDLVERRLAACVNVLGGLRSIYRWQGKIEDEEEKLLLIKTVEEKLEAVRDVVLARHPYEVPEFVVLPIARIEGPYRDWLVASVSAP